MYSTRVLMSNADTAEIIFPQRDLFCYHLLFLGARLEEAGFGWMLEKQKHSSGLNVIMPERSLQPAAWEEVKERGGEGVGQEGEQQKKVQNQMSFYHGFCNISYRLQPRFGKVKTCCTNMLSCKCREKKKIQYPAWLSFFFSSSSS